MTLIRCDRCKLDMVLPTAYYHLAVQIQHLSGGQGENGSFDLCPDCLTAVSRFVWRDEEVAAPSVPAAPDAEAGV